MRIAGVFIVATLRWVVTRRRIRTAHDSCRISSCTHDQYRGKQSHSLTQDKSSLSYSSTVSKVMMGDQKRNAMTRSRRFLIDNIADFDEVLEHVIHEKIFSDMTLDDIKAGRDRVKKISRLVDHFLLRVDSYWEQFLTALRSAEHGDCADHIEQNYAKERQNDCGSSHAIYGVNGAPLSSKPVPPEKEFGQQPQTLHSEQPAFVPAVSPASKTGSRPFGFPVQVSSAGSETGSHYKAASPSATSSASTRGQAKMADQQVSEYERQFQNDPSNVYKMTSTPRGMAVIINNEDFEQLPQREGSKKDVVKLHTLFKYLGFEVCSKRNQTAKCMKQLLRGFAQMEALKTVDAVVVVILSHGADNDIIFGTDGCERQLGLTNYIQVEEVRDIFSARKCPAAAGKPKLIVTQACRGRNQDTVDSVQRKASNTSGSGSESLSSSSQDPSRVPDMADMCFLHSTVKGYVAYRDPVEGSPFIQVLTDVFWKRATSLHLMDMMIEVTQILSQQDLQADTCTVPSQSGTMTKKCFFNPPQPAVNAHKS